MSKTLFVNCRNFNLFILCTRKKHSHSNFIMKKKYIYSYWALEPRGGVTLQLKTNLTLEVLRSIEVALLISLSFSLLVNSHVLSLVLIILGWTKYVKLIGLRNYLMPWTIHIGSFYVNTNDTWPKKLYRCKICNINVIKSICGIWNRILNWFCPRPRAFARGTNLVFKGGTIWVVKWSARMAWTSLEEWDQYFLSW